MEQWNKVSDKTPPDGVELETKIHDDNGLRNEQTLVFHGGLWWFPDKSMYVYYSPTHWRHKKGGGK